MKNIRTITILFTSLLLICTIFTAFFITTNTFKHTSLKQQNTDTVHYLQFKENITVLKKNKSVTTKKKLFNNLISNEIPKYWIGTKWDFNGVTRIPQKGAIACGYFITNILDDLGFKIKRIYYAQQVSSTMIKELCDLKSIKRYSKIDPLEQYIKSRSKNEVYIVGLDFHTGFIVREEENIYFLHSNYINNKGVVKELINNSEALNNSKSFMIGSLSSNDALIENW